MQLRHLKLNRADPECAAHLDKRTLCETRPHPPNCEVKLSCSVAFNGRTKFFFAVQSLPIVVCHKSRKLVLVIFQEKRDLMCCFGVRVHQCCTGAKTVAGLKTMFAFAGSLCPGEKIGRPSQ